MAEVLSHSRKCLLRVSEYNTYYIRPHYNSKHKYLRMGTDSTLLSPREQQCTTAANEVINSHGGVATRIPART